MREMTIGLLLIKFGYRFNRRWFLGIRNPFYYLELPSDEDLDNLPNGRWKLKITRNPYA